MNEQIRWYPSLVKKYSSSNHIKLINQLRSEVIKYPLNNKKNKSLIKNTDTNIDNKNKANNSSPQDISYINSTVTKEANDNKSTVSFNNAKNFSIYNNYTTSQNIKVSTNPEKSNSDSYSPTFKDRLYNIDMK